MNLSEFIFIQMDFLVFGVEGNKSMTFCDNGRGLASLNAGSADGWLCDVSPVHHLVHAVVRHSNHHLILRNTSALQALWLRTSTMIFNISYINIITTKHAFG